MQLYAILSPPVSGTDSGFSSLVMPDSASGGCMQTMSTQICQQSNGFAMPELVNEVEVSRYRKFHDSHWREAILCYLFGMWRGDSDMTMRSWIAFDRPDLRITLRRNENRYFAYYAGVKPFAHEETCFVPDDSIVVLSAAPDVEVGLVKFVKNNRVQQLTIVFPYEKGLRMSAGNHAMPRPELRFQKTERRGDLLISARGLNTLDEIQSAKWF